MRRLIVLFAMVPALILGACGDDDDADDGATATTALAAATTTSSVPTLSAELVLAADLVGGAAEVPDGGDPDGKGRAVVTLKPATSEVCYQVTIENIAAPTLAHIHDGKADVAGPVVVNFAPPLMGCTKNVDKALMNRIAFRPDEFYVNVHTADYPKGAIRGQLMNED
jgi:hypothetical protein